MLFPKGPRFNPQKIPDVPGPNTYNLDQESNLGAYKKGAILEKTDRFNKDKPSDIPGPGAYNTEKPLGKSTMANGTKHTSADRYAILQRRLEDLERVHAEGKQAHQVEVDRLKTELARSRQTSSDQADRLDKLKKQNDTLDTRLQELRKSSSNDQTEIKDLRVKLRLAEHERSQLSMKQGDVGETKKALQALESRRRDEVRDKDRKIVELEKALAGEKKKREGSDGKLKEVTEKSNEEAQKLRQASQELQLQLDEARKEAQKAQSSLAAMKGHSGDKEEQLVTQLEQYRSLMARVADEYGRLASVTVPVHVHSHLKQNHAALELRTLRLERKLTNSEAQVVELANLIRQTEERSEQLGAELRDAQVAVAFYSQVLSDGGVLHQPSLDRGLEDEILGITQVLHDSEIQVRDVNEAYHRLLHRWYQSECNQLLLSCSIADRAVLQEQQTVQRQTVELAGAVAARDSLMSQLDSLRGEMEATQQQYIAANSALADARLDNATLTQKVGELEENIRVKSAHHKEALRKEKETAQRLTATTQMTKMSEEGLRAEVEQLTTELTDAERYQEAYYNLVDEVGTLVDRNNLAEDEANRLSKFNAEILGHHNPSQRIMYVDRIRRELAETKQELLMLTRDRDVVVNNNEELQQELKMYKSVMVPNESKPRTNITRVARTALASRNLNVSVTRNTSVAKAFSTSTGIAKSTQQTPHLDAIPGDMTLDEIM